MVFEHRFRVAAPLEAVRAFHARSASMGQITPPPAVVRVHEAPEALGEDDEMAFTIWLGPLPLRWRARIEAVAEDGFRDVQLSGPFARWEHEHRFADDGAGGTVVHDRIEGELARAPVRWLVGAGMWATLPLLFAYRAWRTRRLLEG